MTEQIPQESTKKEKEFYKKNPNVLMYFSVDQNNQIIFDYDETKIDVSDAILLAHNTVNEFLKTIGKNIKQNQQSQQQTDKQ